MTAAICIAAAAFSATELQSRFLETRLPLDKQAWYEACEREGIDVTKRARSVPDERGVCKFNRDSRLVQIVLGKNAAPSGDWSENLGADGTLHVAWTRKENGAVCCSYSAPTNWSVFVNAYKGRVTRYGSKIMKTRCGDDRPPMYSLPSGWRVVEGEEYTGANVREAYATFEKDGEGESPPRVEAVWPDAGIRAVYGATGIVVNAESAVFFPVAKQPPVGMYTPLSDEGCLALGVTHHVEGMQAGPYRNVPYPEKEINAGFNLLFALRDGFRMLGFDKVGSLKGGKILLSGFDSHYPNGHADFPAHFHIINDCRDGSQVSHFYMDPTTGRLTQDHFQDMNKPAGCWDRVYVHFPGDKWEMYDGYANAAYSIKMLDDGTGLEVSLPNGQGAFRAAGSMPCECVSLQIRDSDGTWRHVGEYRVEDDPSTGVMTVGDETIRYDPDTSRRIR